MIYEIAGYDRSRTDRVKSREGGRLIWHSTNMINLCVDTFEEGRQCGRLYHMYTKEPVSFSSLFQALGRMDELYDELQFPQAATKLRSFLTVRGEVRGAGDQRKEMKETEEFGKVIEHRGKRATFLIRVQYRQHSSWQGEVVWVDQQKKEYFRSALELVRLLDSALREEEKQDAE